LVKTERAGDVSRERSVYEEPAHSLKHLVEFLCCHLSNRVKNEVVFKGEKSLRTNKSRLRELSAFKVADIKRNGEGVVMCTARDLAENQVRAWKIGNH